MSYAKNILFVSLITLPLILSVSQANNQGENTENRNTVPVPSLSFERTKAATSISGKVIGVYKDGAAFIDNFDSYYSDNFGFRSQLFELFRYIKIHILHTELLPQKVVHGQDGWFFLGDSYGDVIKASKGIVNFTETELMPLKQDLLDQERWLEEQGIRYYATIAPNKHSVYGAYLPIAKSERTTKLEQVKKMMAGEQFNIIDLKSNFPDTPTLRLFHKTNTHWNDYGAFLGYLSLMQKVKNDFPDISVLSMSDFNIDTAITYQEDLTKLILVKQKEEKIVFRYNIPETGYNVETATNDEGNAISRWKNDESKLKILVFHDSFSWAWLKYLKETFNECLFIRNTRFNKEIIKKEKPDIVIREIVERNIDELGY